MSIILSESSLANRTLSLKALRHFLRIILQCAMNEHTTNYIAGCPLALLGHHR